ncbi:hypothetical protein [Dactylosporangium sp. CA-233914]|uniref:hypothetical protein n=1 Tax=Dactylosporangium sp. CA-233914 TaxID=3239934 RepID=UPI003D8CF34E
MHRDKISDEERRIETQRRDRWDLWHTNLPITQHPLGPPAAAVDIPAELGAGRRAFTEEVATLVAVSKAMRSSWIPAAATRYVPESRQQVTNP